MHADFFRLAPARLVQLLDLNDLTHTSGQDRAARKIVKALKTEMPEKDNAKKSERHWLLLRNAVNRA